MRHRLDARNIRLAPCIGILLLLGHTSPSSAQGVLYSDQALRYSFLIPNDWRQLPPDKIKQVAAAMAGQTGISPKFDAWIQRSDKPDGAYPYLLIGHQRCRTPTLTELAASAKEGGRALEELQGKMKGMVSKTSQAPPVIDAPRNMVYFDCDQTVHVGNVGDVRSRICIFPGKLGIVQFNFCSTAAEFEDEWRGFQPVLDTFHFDPGFGYNEASTTPPRGFDFSRVIFAGVLGAILGPFLYARLQSGSKGYSAALRRVRFVCAFLVIFGGLQYFLDPPTGPISTGFFVTIIAIGVIGFVAVKIVGKRDPAPSTAVNPEQSP